MNDTNDMNHDDHDTYDESGPREPWEGAMSSEFDRRVRHLHEAPLSLESVKGKAMNIRRRRRAAVAGGIVAAAAVIVPVAVAAGNGDRTAPREIEFATPSAPSSATDSPTDSATSAPPAAPADPEALGVDYLEGGRTLHRADGTAVDLPQVYVDGGSFGDLVWAAAQSEDGTFVVDLLDADGATVDSFETPSVPVTDAGGDVLVNAAADGDLQVRWDGGEATLPTGLSEYLQVVAVTGGPTCEQGSGCRVWIDDQSVEDGMRVVTADGEVAPVESDIVSLNAVGDDGVAAVTESVPGDQESCGGLLDLDTGTYLTQSCDYSFLGVSPGGTYADTSHPYLDGFGNGWAAIVDRDGTEVARFTPEDGAITGQVWQDDEHLLVVTHAYTAQEWSVVRLGVDGSQEVVAGPVPGDSEQYPYAFIL